MSQLLQTPSSNTGSNCSKKSLTHPSGYEVCIDWLQGVFTYTDQVELEACFSFIFESLGDVVALEPGRPVVHGKRFENSGRSALGGACAWNPPSESLLPGQAWVSIPGTVLRQVTVKEVFAVVRELRDRWNFKATRVDVALDDYQKKISFQQVAEAISQGNYSGFRNYQIIQSPDNGSTIYMGSPSSDRRLRFYNRAALDSSSDCYRWEVQFRDELSNQVFDEVSKFREDFDKLMPVYLGCLVTGAVNFVDRKSGNRLDRQEMLPWWSEFVEAVGGQLKLRLPKLERSIDKSFKWIQHQVQTTLAILADYLGSNFYRYISDQVKRGKKRLTRYHYSILNQSRLNFAPT